MEHLSGGSKKINSKSSCTTVLFDTLRLKALNDNLAAKKPNSTEKEKLKKTADEILNWNKW